MFSADYEAVAAEFLRALRDHRSQVAFSRRLKYKSNVAYLWESKRSWPTAAVTLWAGSRVGIDPYEGFKTFYRLAPKWLDKDLVITPMGVATILNDLRSDLSIAEVSKRCGKSRFAVSRWLKGDTEPRLPDFFRLIEAITSRLLEFISCFVDPNALPSLRLPWKQLNAARHMISDLPWSPAVLLTLETEDYHQLDCHKDGWLAKRLGLSLDEEKECLNVLETTGQIKWVKSHWHVEEVQTIDTRAIPSYGRTLKSYWTKAGLERIQREQDGIFSFNVFTCSQADYEKIRDMQRAHYREMRALIAKSSPAERVVAVNLHTFPVDDYDGSHS